jgi:hypothetical protein
MNTKSTGEQNNEECIKSTLSILTSRSETYISLNEEKNKGWISENKLRKISYKWR